VDEQHRTQFPKRSSEIGLKQIIYYEQGLIKSTRGPERNRDCEGPLNA